MRTNDFVQCACFLTLPNSVKDSFLLVSTTIRVFHCYFTLRNLKSNAKKINLSSKLTDDTFLLVLKLWIQPGTGIQQDEYLCIPLLPSITN